MLIKNITRNLKKNLQSLPRLARENKVFLSFFIVSFGVFLTWLLAFWPGVMTLDSLNSWSQILTNHYTNWHPYIFTLYLKAVTFLFFSPVSVVIFQIFVSSLLGAYVFGRFYQEAERKWPTIIAFILFVTSVPIGLYNITVWKDVIFSQLVVFWGVLIYFLIKDQKKIDKNWLIVLLGFLLFFTSTVRHNGVILLVIVPFFFIVNKLMERKKAFFFIVIAVTFYLLSQTLIPSALEVDMNNKLLTEGNKVQTIAAIMSSNNHVYRGSVPLDRLFRLVPYDVLRNNYTCRRLDPVLFDGRVNAKLLDDKQFLSDFHKIYYRLLIDNFPEAIGDRACIATSIFLGADTSQYYNVLDYRNPYPQFANNLGIKQEIKLPFLHDIYNKVVNLSAHFPANLIFRSLIIPFLGYIFGLFFYRRDKALFYYSLFMLIQVPFILTVLPASDWRYLYFLHLGFFFEIIMLLANIDLSSIIKGFWKNEKTD